MFKKCFYFGLMLIVVVAAADEAVAAGIDSEGVYYGVASNMAQSAMDNGTDAYDDPYYNSLVLYSTRESLVTYVNDHISPGERKHFTKNVTEDILYLNVDLKWMNPDVGLELQVFSPSGEQVGLFCDDSDGSVDHRINIDIFTSDGGYIEKGRWDYFIIYDWGVQTTEFTI